MSDRAGYVYLCGDGEVCKIGYSKNPEKRILDFLKEYPNSKLIAVIQDDDAKRLEVALHHAFANKRARYEWFNLSPTDIETITNLNKIPPQHRLGFIAEIECPCDASPCSAQLICVAGAFLERLRAREQVKPKDQRRDVPTIPELAKAAGITPNNMRRIFDNGTEGINRHAIASVISTLRARGFQVQFDDVFEMVEGEVQS